MSTFLFNLTMVAMGAVLLVLLIGVFSMARGGKFRERWSNKLMWLRVALQAVAIVCLCAFIWWRANH